MRENVSRLQMMHTPLAARSSEKARSGTQTADARTHASPAIFSSLSAPHLVSYKNLHQGNLLANIAAQVGQERQRPPDQSSKTEQNNSHECVRARGQLKNEDSLHTYTTFMEKTKMEGLRRKPQAASSERATLN